MANDLFHFQLGGLQCAVIADANEPLREVDVSGFFPKDTERMLKIFREWPVPLAFSINILCVETSKERILVDSGVGFAEKDLPGQLLDNLRAAGITPQSIDTVIISHFHRDHIGGLLDGEGKAVFERARLVVPRLEYEYWMNEQVLATLNPDSAQRLRQTFGVYGGRLIVAADDTEIAPGIHYAGAPGHTPGHSAVLLESQGKRLLHFVDTMHYPIQLNALDAVPSADAQPEIAVRTRRNMVERAIAENLLVMGYHMPFPGIYAIRQSGPLREWVEGG